MQISRRDIRHALKRLQRPDELRNIALATLPINQAYSSQCAVSTGEAVRAVLLHAINSLKPADAHVSAEDFLNKAWRHYLILHEQYVNNQPPRQLFSKFGLVEGSYFQEQAHAIDRLAHVLTDWNAHANEVVSRWAHASTPVQPHTGGVEASMVHHLRDELSGEVAVRAALAMTRAVHDHGSLESAKAIAQQSLELSRTAGQNQVANQLSIELAAIEGRFANYPAAEAMFLDAIQKAQGFGDAKAKAAALAGLGISWMWQGHVKPARACMEESLSLYQAMGAEAEASAMLGFIAWLDAHQGNFEAAITRSQAGLELITTHPEAESRPLLLMTLGVVCMFQGEFAEAERRFNDAFSSATRLNRLDGVAGATGCLAELELERGDIASAERHAHKTIALSQTIAHWEAVVAARLVLAKAALAKGDAASASHAATQAIESAQTQCCPWFECAALIVMGRIEIRHGDNRTAQARLNGALRIAHRLNSALYENKTNEALKLMSTGEVQFV